MSESIQINNETLTYNKIWYIDQNNGNDANSGSEQNPFQTIKTGLISQQDGDQIFVNGGEYELTQIISNYSSYHGQGISTQKNLDIIGDTNDIPILLYDGTKTTTRDAPVFSGMPSGFNIYNFYINFIPKNSTNNYSKQIWSHTEGGYYNLFINVQGTNPQSLSYYNTNPTDQPKIYNSVIYFEQTPLADYSGNPLYTNVITNKTFDNGRSIYSLENYNIDINDIKQMEFDQQLKNQGDPSILNPDGTVSHIGVYGGPYAWGDWNKLLLYKNNKFYYQNSDTELINLIGSSISKEDFDNYGSGNFSNIENIINNGYSILYFNEVQTNSSNINSELSFIPNNQLIKMQDYIYTQNFQNIDKITLNQSNLNIITNDLINDNLFNFPNKGFENNSFIINNKETQIEETSINQEDTIRKYSQNNIINNYRYINNINLAGE